MSSSYETIGDALSSLRVHRGLYQREVAEHMDLDQGRVGAIERQTDMQVSTLTRYIRAIGPKSAYITMHFDDHDDGQPFSYTVSIDLLDILSLQ